MPEGILKAIADNWKTIAAVVGGVVIAVSLTGVIVSHYDRRVYEDLLKKHDQETAERVTAAFVKQIEDLKKQHEEDKAAFARRVKNICDKFGIGYDLVLKPAYI